MSTIERFPIAPKGDNYELQQAFLAQEQRRISAELFESGVAPGIVAAVAPHETTDVMAAANGVQMVNQLFVPGLSEHRDGDHTVPILSLVVATPNETSLMGSLAYYGLGRIDEAARIVHPFPHVDEHAAEAVFGYAEQLRSERDAGIIPDLRTDLLAVNNPNQSIGAPMNPSHN